jgi:hypothetical protein
VSKISNRGFISKFYYSYIKEVFHMVVTAQYAKDQSKKYVVGITGLIVMFSLYGALIPIISNISPLPPIVSVALISVLFGVAALYFTLEVFL